MCLCLSLSLSLSKIAFRAKDAGLASPGQFEGGAFSHRGLDRPFLKLDWLRQSTSTRGKLTTFISGCSGMTEALAV